MAIAFVQDFSGQNDFISSVTVTVPGGGVAQGNHLILSYYSPDGASDVVSITDTAGNTYTRHGRETLGTLSSCLYSAYMTTGLSSGNTVVATTSSGAGGLIVCSEFSGLASSSYFDQYLSADIAFDTALSSGATSTTTQSDELIWGQFFAGSNSATFTPGSGYTQSDTGAYSGFTTYTYLNQYKIVAATGAQTSTATASVATAAVALVGTFKAGSSVVNATVDLDTGNVVAAATGAVVAPPRPRPAHPYTEINVRM